MKKTHAQAAYDTSKRKGFIAERAIVPRVVEVFAGPTNTLLDFGAGKHATHTLRMRANGFHVTAYEQPEFANSAIHDVNALKRQYDIVFASNVLNVLPNRKAVVETLEQIRSAAGGLVVFNYPVSPRKWTAKNYPKGVPAEVINRLIQQVFDVQPIRVYGTRSAPVWALGYVWPDTPSERLRSMQWALWLKATRRLHQ